VDLVLVVHEYTNQRLGVYVSDSEKSRSAVRELFKRANLERGKVDFSNPVRRDVLVALNPAVARAGSASEFRSLMDLRTEAILTAHLVEHLKLALIAYISYGDA
jgi:hypothetical protein